MDQLTLQRVTHITSYHVHGLIEITCSEATIYTDAYQLLFLLKHNAWQKAGHLSVGDALCQSDGMYTYIEDIQHRTGTYTVYSISVSETHNLYATHRAILVHNSPEGGVVSGAMAAAGSLTTAGAESAAFVANPLAAAGALFLTCVGYLVYSRAQERDRYERNEYEGNSNHEPTTYAHPEKKPLSTASPMPSKLGDTSPHTGTTTPEPASSSTGTAFPEDRNVTTIAGETTPSEEPQPVAIDNQEHTSYQYNQDIDDTSQKTIFPGDTCPNLRDYGAQAPGKPLEVDGFVPPKNWDGKKQKHSATGQYGWRDKKGNIWAPTGWGPLAHGGLH